jgi:hypothetical protein
MFNLGLCVCGIFLAWQGIVQALAWVNGYSRFRARFPPQEDQILSDFRLVDARFRFTQENYASIRFGERGLHIAPNPLLKPLLMPGFAFVPWTDLQLVGPILPLVHTESSGWMEFESRSNPGFRFALSDLPALGVRDRIAENPA